MKIIHSYDTWLPLTMPWLYNQVRYLPDEFENHIVCARNENPDHFRLPHIHSLDNASRLVFYYDLWSRKTGRKRRQLLKVAEKKDARLLHSHFGHTAWENMKTVRKANLRHVVTFYGQDVDYLPVQRPVWRKRYAELFNHVDAVLCEGPYMKQSIEKLGCPGEKVIIHHLGVEVDNIPYQPRSWQPGTRLKVLIAAGFREKKGITYALKALAAIQDSVDLEITIIGDASKEQHSKLEKQKILKTISEGNLGDKVDLLGFQSHSRFFEEAYGHHLFISPSVTAATGDTEGGAPISLIEMAASGMPIISTRHCDIPGVIRHGETGLLADEKDTNALAAHLMWMVENHNKWGDMLIEGNRHMRNVFNARSQGEKLAGIYKRLVG